MTLSARSRHRTPGIGLTIRRQTQFRFASRLREWLAATWRHLVRSRALPAELRSLVMVERGERVLSVGRDANDGYVLVATDRALHHRTGDNGWSRLGWEQITRVSWDTAAGSLVIAGRTSAVPGRIVLPLRERGTMPELVLERVTHTRLGCWHVPLADDRHILIEARRRPAAGELLWLVNCDDSGLDLSSDGTRGQIEHAIARLSEDLGVTRAGLPQVIERPRFNAYPNVVDS